MKQVTIRNIAEILEAAILSNPDNLDVEIKWVCSTDLISNVLYYCLPNSLLITGLIHPQVVRAAEVAGIEGIVFVQNNKPDTDTIELAKKQSIPLLITPFCMFTASGKLFQAGLTGCPKK